MSHIGREFGRAFRSRFLPIFLTSFILSSLAPLCSAQELGAAARALGRQIVVSVGSGKSIALEVQNRSQLSAEAVTQAHVTLAAELESHKMRFTESAEADARIRVTFSENLQSYLLVAEIERGDAGREVAIVESPLTTAAPLPPAEMLPLEKQFLHEQSAPILDAAIIAGADARPATLLVLEPERVALYAREGGKWIFRQAQPVLRAGPWPRDLRGRLLAEAQGFRAYLPGMVCVGAFVPGLTLECRALADAWPVPAGARRRAAAEFSPRKNFFTGRVMTDTGVQLALPESYSIAVAPDQGSQVWVATGADGRVYLLKPGDPPAAVRAAWGSDIAGIESECGGALVLAALREERAGETSVAAFRYARGEFVAASRPLALPGAVTAMWTSADGGNVLVVTRNPETKNYEAYTLAIPCGR